MSTILVADTSATTRAMVRSHFEELGHRVVECSDGVEAIGLVRRHSPELLILETDLPPLSGVLLTRFVRTRHIAPRMRIAIYGDAQSRRDHLAGQMAGADLVVAKEIESFEAITALLTVAAETTDVDAGAVPTGAFDPDVADGTEIRELEEASVTALLAGVYERELFVSSVAAEILKAGAGETTFAGVVERVLSLVRDFTDTDIAAAVILWEREARTIVLPGTTLFRNDVEQFSRLCLDEFYRMPGTEAIRSSRDTILGVHERDDYDHVRIDGKRVSSYHSEALSAADGTLIGMLHLGHLDNNYFGGILVEEIGRLATAVASVLAAAVRFHTTDARRLKINTIFAKFVPEEVIHDLLSQSDDAEMAVGEKRTVAILFSDIRSFTVISEHNSAEQIVSFLNNYLERMVTIIRHHGGFIDKFIGDAILAVFGAPVSYEDNAARAVRAAQEMSAALASIDVSGLVLPESGFATGIGVHEGTVIVGNIGSQDKFDYTVIGDNVNLASRLEGLTKHYRVHVLLSDVVVSRLPEDVRTREVDTVRVKGKEQATTLYTVADETQFGLAAADEYRKALSMYKLGNWSTAIEYFERVLGRHPEDYLAAMYIERCREFAISPPDADWGGAIKLDFK